jgi:hypothetical protein
MKIPEREVSLIYMIRKTDRRGAQCAYDWGKYKRALEIGH